MFPPGAPVLGLPLLVEDRPWPPEGSHGNKQTHGPVGVGLRGYCCWGTAAATIAALLLAPTLPLLLLLWWLLLWRHSGGRGAVGRSIARGGGDQCCRGQYLRLVGQAQLLEGELIKGFIEGDVLGAGDDVLGVAELGVDAVQQVHH